METHAPHRKTLIRLVAFTLTCAALTIAAYTSFGGSVPLAPQGYRFEIPFPDAESLLQGSDVDMAGVKIGHVVSVGRNGNTAVATVQMDSEYAPIHADATAIVRTKSLLGEAYIELAPGPKGAAPVGDGGELAASQVRPAVTLDQFLEAFTPAARARTRALFAGLATAFSGRVTALNDSLGYAAPVAANLGTILTTLSRETPQLHQLVRGSATVLTALGQRKGDLQAAVTAGDDVFSATAERNRQLAATVAALPAFLAQLHATSQTITAASPDLNRAVAALLPSAPLLRPVLSEINTYAPEFRSLFRELPITIAAGKKGLPALTSILKSVPTAFNQLYPTSRQLIPVLQLLAAYGNSSLVAPLVNTASITNGTMVGPGGKVIHRGTGALFLSNETPVGWVHRLPTNRSNPYQTPTGLMKLGTQGFLDSYDCRNVNNPLYLPALGTGVPPCVTQGPWVWGGVNAYYPRLQPAPK